MNRSLLAWIGGGAGLFAVGAIAVGLFASAASLPLYGFAWSGYDAVPGLTGGAGWISFASRNCDTNGDGLSEGVSAGADCPAAGSAIAAYGVFVEETTNGSGEGGVRGAAWSSNLGWLSFDRADTGNPPQDDIGAGSGPIARWTGNALEGWARFISATSTVNAGGWDGWVKFNGTGYGVVRDGATQDLSGYAWGGDTVVGWMKFKGAAADGSPYAVSFSSALPAPVLSVTLDANPPTGQVPLAVVLSGQVVTSNATDDIRWDFDCGNGAPHGIATTTAAITTQTHNCTYNSPGAYVTRLTVRQGSGAAEAVRTTQANVMVSSAITVSLIANPSSGRLPLTTTLTATVTTGSPDPIRYVFECDINDASVGTYDTGFINQASYTATNLCTYASTGAKVARVTATQGTNAATAVTNSAVTNIVILPKGPIEE